MKITTTHLILINIIIFTAVGALWYTGHRQWKERFEACTAQCRTDDAKVTSAPKAWTLEQCFAACNAD